MKKSKIKIKDLRVKSFITSNPDKVKVKASRNDGGYTWVG